ncbi:MAG: hypothetical protein LBG80_14505, partial [Bacteroidales bacterium]|nr:hypothetical protein [Bacteroidales bacterium]
MNNNEMKFIGIKTNNLKNIDISILKNKLNCIIGPSGSGKSSLAFDTIYAICEHECRMITGDEEIYKYLVDDYSDLLFAVALKQTNYNSNERSTIATYYGLDRFFKFLFSQKHGVPPETFSFNSYSSSCKECSGFGYIRETDLSTIIDYDATVEEIPFLPWRKSKKDYYKRLLIMACEEQSIPLNVPFRELNDSNKDFLIYGLSKTKFKINYIQAGRKRVLTDEYHGIKNIDDNKKLNTVQLSDEYIKKPVCPACKGTRFNSSIQKYQVRGKSIGDVYLMEFDELYDWLEKEKSHISESELSPVIKFIKNIKEMKLGYLFLNRSIPSLSGGEFQRLRLSQILHTKFEDILIILDEPLSSLHAQEKICVIDKISKMKSKNTILVVEHNVDILSICYKTIILDGSGK